MGEKNSTILLLLKCKAAVEKVLSNMLLCVCYIVRACVCVYVCVFVRVFVSVYLCMSVSIGK